MLGKSKLFRLGLNNHMQINILTRYCYFVSRLRVYKSKNSHDFFRYKCFFIQNMNYNSAMFPLWGRETNEVFI